MTKFVCFSDTHGFEKTTHIPKGDILLFAGDICTWPSWRSIESFNLWLGTLDFPRERILMIAGNHDVPFETFPSEARKRITNAIYLQDNFALIDGYKIYGSPWQPVFGIGWAFNLERGEPLKEKWSRIPEDTDILITHGPPHGVLDRVAHGESVGCASLRERLSQLKNVKLHLFGHIHEAAGMYQDKSGRISLNASIAGMRTKEAVVVDIEQRVWP